MGMRFGSMIITLENEMENAEGFDIIQKLTEIGESVTKCWQGIQLNKLVMVLRKMGNKKCEDILASEVQHAQESIHNEN